jgi:type VI secretion system secreted protein Hcp
VQDLSLTKYIDKSSCDLMLACCTGKHYDSATLVVRKAGTTPLEYLKLTLSQVMVTAVSTGGSGGEDRLTENVTLNFTTIIERYTQQTATGGVAGSFQFGWDLVRRLQFGQEGDCA